MLLTSTLYMPRYCRALSSVLQLVTDLGLPISAPMPRVESLENAILLVRQFFTHCAIEPVAVCGVFDFLHSTSPERCHLHVTGSATKRIPLGVTAVLKNV